MTLGLRPHQSCPMSREEGSIATVSGSANQPWANTWKFQLVLTESKHGGHPGDVVGQASPDFASLPAISKSALHPGL